MVMTGQSVALLKARMRLLLLSAMYRVLVGVPPASTLGAPPLGSRTRTPVGRHRLLRVATIGHVVPVGLAGMPDRLLGPNAKSALVPMLPLASARNTRTRLLPLSATNRSPRLSVARPVAKHTVEG